LQAFYNLVANHPQLEGESSFSNHPQVGDDFEDNLIFQLPWGHIKILIDKIKDSKALDFYLKETIENNWSRDVLALQIKSDLFKR